MRRGRRLRENPALQFLYDDLFVVEERDLDSEWPVFRLYLKLSQMNLCVLHRIDLGSWRATSMFAGRNPMRADLEPLRRLLSPRVLAVEALGGWEPFRVGPFEDGRFELALHLRGLWSDSVAIVRAPCTALTRVPI